MALSTLFIATLLISLIMILTTLSTSMIYAATQILSRCAEFLFDLRVPTRL